MEFKLLMLSAMYENGGNTTHRFLDGHPELYVYPFESQLGTRLVQDHLTSMFPTKYRWPVFDMEAKPSELYKAIIDEECKVRIRTPHVSKFRNAPFNLDDDERKELFHRILDTSPITRPVVIEAFFRATFEAWKDHRNSGREHVYVGYSPIVVVDGDKIFTDFPQARVLHIVRNPWSAYAETKDRPVPLSLGAYMSGWILNQYYAQVYRKLYPDRLIVLRYEDLIENPASALAPVCQALGIEADGLFLEPSWNGEPLPEVYPWGTIRMPDPESNKLIASQLTSKEKDHVRCWAGPFLQAFGYEDFI